MEEKTLELFIKHLSLALYSDLNPSDQAFLAPSFKELMSDPASSTLKNSKKLFESLYLNFQSIKASPLYPKFTENEAYQKALQKLDVEVRNHLKQELQMKLYHDDIKEKIKTLSSSFLQTYNEERLKFLNISNEKLAESIHFKDCEIENLKFSDCRSDELEAKLLAENLRNEEEKIKLLLKKIEKDEKSLEKKKDELKGLEGESQGLQEIFSRLKSIAQGYDEKNSNRMVSIREEKAENRNRGMAHRQAHGISPICIPDDKFIKIARLSQSTKRIRNGTSKNLKDCVIRSRTKIRLQMYAAK